VLHTEHPLIIFAGAGTGKTRVITYRIAHLLSTGVSPWHILAVTFTNKAAEEMRRRVDELMPGQGRSVLISTFHSFCAQFLRIEADQIGLNREFLIYDAGDQKHVLKDCVKELNLDDKKYKPSRIMDIISRAKDELLDADSYSIHSLTSNDPFRQTAAAVYALYQKKLNTAGALDFGDLLLRTVFALRDNEVIRAKYQDRFRYILVDEYQDTNHAQYMLTKYLSGKHKNLCVVGDDDQSVYSWRGADIRNILEFERDYPGCRTIKLEQNYRSTPNILESAWQVVKNNQKRVDKKLWTSNRKGEDIALLENINEIEEAERIVREIEQLKKRHGFRLNDFAVFYRTNAQSRVLEDGFRRSGIAYTIVGTVRFYERAEVKDILAYLRLIHNPQDNVSFKRVINVPRRGLGKTSLETLERFANERGLSLWGAIDHLPSLEVPKGAKRALAEFKALITDFQVQRSALSVKEITTKLLDRIRYIDELEAENTPEAKSRIENIYELVSAVDEFERRSPDKTLSGYLTQISLVSDLDTWDGETDRVTLMTLHLAKGLEFKAVFLTGLEEGLFPIGEAGFEPEELEEERRLMYVGMTRAKERLFLSWAAERRIFGKSRWNLPSRFIGEAGLASETAAASSGRIRPEAPSRPSFRRQQETEYEYGVDLPPDEPPAPKPEPVVDRHVPFPIGCAVRHAQFGEGKVIERSGSGEDLKLVVLFNTGQWKKLVARYANLQQIED
jgi:DNA helicase-2/ATP-dependent DNA helicase PcrA